jgi:hypothetical protein
MDPSKVIAVRICGLLSFLEGLSYLAGTTRAFGSSIEVLLVCPTSGNGDSDLEELSERLQQK